MRTIPFCNLISYYPGFDGIASICNKYPASQNNKAVYTTFKDMPEDEDFYISFKEKQVRVSPVLENETANIHFIVHFQPPVVISEAMEGETWYWFEAGKGPTDLAAELGEIIEDMGI